MSQVLSDKKNFADKEYLAENKQLSLCQFLEKYTNLFVVHWRNNIKKAYSYLVRLLKCKKTTQTWNEWSKLNQNKPTTNTTIS